MDTINDTKYPLISVIIPIYNSEKYLKKCIQSVSNQTYKKIEIILVNDGSTDKSLSICNSFKAIDNRINIVNIANGGVSNARNIGIKHAKGTFIQFIDSDDYIVPQYIETLFNEIKNNHAQLSVCAIESYNSKGDKPLDSWSVKNAILNFNHLDKFLFLELIQKFLLFGPVNKLYIKEIIDSNKIAFDTSLSYGEDLLFNFNYFEYISTIAITNKVAYHYIHDNATSLSKKRYNNKTALALRIHNTLHAFFIKHNLNDFKSLQVLYTRLFDYYYNEVFLIATDEALSFKSKFKNIKTLLLQTELKKSYQYIPNNKYAKWIVICMKYRVVLPFLIFKK